MLSMASLARRFGNINVSRFLLILLVSYYLSIGIFPRIYLDLFYSSPLSLYHLMNNS